MPLVRDRWARYANTDKIRIPKIANAKNMVWDLTDFIVILIENFATHV